MLDNSSEMEKGPRFDRFGDFRQEVKFVGEMDAAVKKLMGYGLKVAYPACFVVLCCKIVLVRR